MEPAISYIIAASPRCGSNLLCEALWSTGLAGRPEEHFLVWHRAVREPERLQADFVKPWLVPAPLFLERVLAKGTGPNGVFGVKIMWNYFDIVIDNMRTIPGYRGLEPSELLKAAFPNLRYIHITRSDRVRQAVSLAKAMQTQKWTDLEPWILAENGPATPADRERIQASRQRVSERSLEYDFGQIALLEDDLRKQDESWEAYFAESGIEPYRVVYEEFAEAYEQTAVDILGFLGIPRPDEIGPLRRAMKKQTDAVNEEWTRRFKEDLAKRSG